MRELTLVIPTYNRAKLFAALLSYLEVEKADCRVLVLDSSRPEVQAANRVRAADSRLDLEFAEFADELPKEKWRQGIHMVTTPFCALCADDDLVILDGMRQCIDVLRSNPATSVVQGYSFTFLPRPDGDMELNNIVYFTPTIGDASPLERLAKLFRQYQAPCYGIFRTPMLQRTFDTLQTLTEILALELLWSALTVIEGHAVRVPSFSYGRSMGASATYKNWHPLEWFCRDPEGLFAEYVRYRELMAAAVIRRSDNSHKADDVRSILDLIHFRYLAKHAPDSALAFIAGRQMAGIDFADYWPCHEIHLPLYRAAGITTSGPAENSNPVNMLGRDRRYILYPNFYAHLEAGRPKMEDLARLIGVLDNYPLERNAVSARRNGLLPAPLTQSSSDRQGTDFRRETGARMVEPVHGEGGAASHTSPRKD
jgi:glycosyltransferase domain-containing protein